MEIGAHDSVEQYISFAGDKKPQNVKKDVSSGKCFISIFFLIYVVKEFSQHESTQEEKTRKKKNYLKFKHAS